MSKGRARSKSRRDARYQRAITRQLDSISRDPSYAPIEEFLFWTCPVEEHGERRDEHGWPVVTVDWRGDVAHCTAPGCGRTSADAGELSSETPAGTIAQPGRCGNEREPDGEVCTSRVYLRPGEVQTCCPQCGAREGAHSRPEWRRLLLGGEAAGDA